MSYFTQDGQGGPLGFASTSNDTSLATLTGARFTTGDGRAFRLVQNGGTALAAGLLVQSPASIGANHTGLTTATAAIGATQITVTLGGTAVTANQYQGGFAVISAGTGIGQVLKVASHPAQSSTSGTVVLTLEDPLKVATAVGDSKTTLTLDPYGSANGADVSTSGVIVAPTTLTGTVIGASYYPIAASSATVPSYGFVQVAGLCPVTNVSTTAVGLDVMSNVGGTAGNVATYVVATGPRVGTTVVAGEAGKAHMVNLQLS